jgi:hypothetical protein
MLTVRIEPELHAILPELSRLNSQRSIGEIIRRLLWNECDRLNLRTPAQSSRTKGRHRFTT